MKAMIYSNKGPVREHNEDALFAAGNVISGSSMASPVELNTEMPGGCFTVIDGMGGYEGGEKAARLIAMSFLEDAEGGDIPAKTGREKIAAVLKRASQKIAEDVAKNQALSSMGAE